MNARVLLTTVPMEVLVNRNGLNGHAVNRTDTYQAWTHALEERHHLKIGCPPVGLRFLKENVPGIDILEYPTWEEYKQAVTRGYDVVGISFFTCSMNAIPHMTRIAREAGVGALWGGGYGVLTPGVEAWFDRTFTGSGEKPLLELLRGQRLEQIKHPAVMADLTYRSFSSKVGYLYTKRGCNMGCSFCSTPIFLPHEDPIGMEEITKVLDVYRDENVANVVIYDETFLKDAEASLAVAKALAERELPWVCLTRADRIAGRVGELVDLHMDGAIIGIESFREGNLLTVAKRENARKIEATIDELVRHGVRTIGTYMICYPEDTAAVVGRDIERLSSLGLFLAQVTILTPFPRTRLWKELEDRIIDKDWFHYDVYHLVWDHPHIGADEARDLLAYAQCKINDPRRFSRKLKSKARRGGASVLQRQRAAASA